MKKILLICFVFLFPTTTFAAGYSKYAVPTKVELVNGGVLIYGAFGDPNSCGKPDHIFVSEQSSTYQSVLTMALTALQGKRELSFYSSKCVGVSFHWSGNIINENRGGEPVYIR